jgi:dihydroxy-acid dehydratase
MLTGLHRGRTKPWKPLKKDRASGPFGCARQQTTGNAMPAYRSRTTTHGRNMAGARGLWRATGM